MMTISRFYPDDNGVVTANTVNTVSSVEDSFSCVMEKLAISSPSPLCLAVAVSGGADSMALALLAHEWATARGGKIIALTVDHGLRSESAQEALQVNKWLEAAGIEHHILRWKHSPLNNSNNNSNDDDDINNNNNDATTVAPSNMQARARDARYELLVKWCEKQGIENLLLAHHLDDQAETFLIRLERGSGVDGLSCMKEQTQRGSLQLLRPLLSLRKAELVEYLHKHRQLWIEDPSNNNREFTRVRMRELLPELDEYGLSPQSLADTAKRMARARDALDYHTAEALTRCARIYEEGCATLNLRYLRELPQEIALRLLSHLLCVVGGRYYRHRFQQLENLFAGIAKTDTDLFPRTFGGCILIMHGETLWIIREVSACENPVDVSVGSKIFWDNRFLLYIAKDSASYSSNIKVSALTAQGWYDIRKQLSASLPDIPKEVMYALPALYQRKNIVAVPHFGWYAPPCLRGKVMLRFQPLKSLPSQHYHVLMGGV